MGSNFTRIIVRVFVCCLGVSVSMGLHKERAMYLQTFPVCVKSVFVVMSVDSQVFPAM